MSTSQVSGISGAVYAASENTTLISAYDIYDRDFHLKLFKKVPRASALSWMRAIKGYMSRRKVRRHQYYFYEEGQWMSAAATIASTTDQTNYVDIHLSAADHDNSGAESFPVVGQLVVFEDEAIGYVVGVDRTSDNDHFVKVKPANTGVTILTSAVVGETMVFYSNAQIEKSTETEGRIPKTDKVTNYIQTFREKYEVTDHAEQNEVEWEFKGQKFLYVKGIDETAQRFAYQEEMGMLITDSSESLGDAVGAGGNTVTLAKGLIPQITDSGLTLEYFGRPDMTTMDDAILLLNKNYGDSEYIVGHSLNFGLGIKNWLVDFAQGGDNGISFMTDEQRISLNFKRADISSYTLLFQEWKVFSHEDTLGAGNMPYQDMAVFIPTGKARNPEPGDGMGDYEPYCQMAFARIPGAPHEDKGDYKMWETGANARSGATDDELTRAIHMASYKSLEIRCRNKFLVLRKAS